MAKGPILVLVVVVVYACALLPAACGGADVAEEVPSGWMLFESDSVSLALPDYFKGGYPGDPGVIALLGEMASGNPDARLATALGLALETMKTDREAVDQLVMWTEPGADGSFASVVAARFAMGGGMTMDEVVEADMGRLLATERTVETMSEDSAYVIVRLSGWEGALTLRHVVYRMAEPFVYVVAYTFDDAADTAALDAVFRESAGTIAVGH